FPDPPRELPRRLADPYTLHQLCAELGVPSVARALPASLAEAEEFAGRVGYPLVAKLAAPRRPGSGSELRGTSVLQTRDELVRTCLACAGPLEVGVLLQEYLPRCPSQDFFVHGYCDARSRCRPGFVGIKERSYPAYTGLTSLGRWVDNAPLHTQATDLVARLGYQGILDLDYRWDPRDGQYKLLDFKPRLGAQFRLFSVDAGIDVVVASHLDLTGRAIPPGSQLAGRRFLVENYDPIAALGYRRSGELSLLWWLMSLRLVDEMAWYARDDLAPFGLMCLRMGWRAMSPLTQRISRRLSHGFTQSLTRTLIRPRGASGAGAPARYRPGRVGRKPESSPTRQADKVLL
ncbi:MAG: carboxylate--amine ligase, partial [Actinobacteria bacterium]|nr:carboxylate--amine ligase [Actinomycetota bacterium]